ncbi:MAG: FGGY-family carbohydrate kinase [Bacillota bacterium]
MQREAVLAIDIGTQSLRAQAFDLRGGIIDSARIPYPAPYQSPRPGWAEQDPALYWNCLGEACRKLWSGGRVSPGSLASVAVTSQRSTVVNLDNKGLPLRPAIVWLDQRRAGNLPPVGLMWRTIFRLAGLTNTLHYLQAEAEANWIMENQPDIWEKTAHYLFLSGYITYMLTGRFVDSTGCQVGYVPFDYRKQAWAHLSNWKWQAIPMPPEILPDLALPGQKMGSVTAKAASFTGLPEGLAVIAAASDKACEVLGSGCLETGQACIGYGTTATINVSSRKYIEPIPLIPPYPSACPGHYNMEVQIFRGFWMVTWFKEEFAWQEKSLAIKEGVAPEELLDRLVAGIPPGSMGLVLQPFWSPGLRHPGIEARGSVIGFKGSHTRAHLYRAILEGLAYAMREGRERIEKRTGETVKELYVCGGGSKSDQMMQITANVFGLPAVRPATYEASGLGAAILAALGSGLYPELKTAVREMTGISRTFDPEPEAVKIYDHLYRKVYVKMYRKLRPLYKSIHSITQNFT